MFSVFTKLKNKSGLLLLSYKRNRTKLGQSSTKFFFKQNLLLTNSITSGICMILGDLIQQEIELRRKLNGKITTDQYDWERARRMFIVGTAIGPLHHYYYIYLDKFLPKANLKTSLIKVMADQLFASPATIIFFFIGMGLLENRTMDEIKAEIYKKMKYVYIGDCMFWPPIQIVNFYYLPSHYRVLYINVATMIFNIFISYMKHYDQYDE